MKRGLILTIFAAWTATGCTGVSIASHAHAPSVVAHTAKPRRACRGSVVTIRDDEQVTCDLTPPQRLDIIFGADLDDAQRGQDSFGCTDLIWNAKHKAFVGEGCDY